ncbi:PTS sugar transporter subunit IIA [Rhodopseudomonas pseudopalustris]|uniref:PTS IIA-like nitrogen-regulatory protein PtsN n=1 Tax=Rhodopseudomonas pseudopalustris TaxID=1513892 RepID=A0A1H8XDY7_9BRAD|nr:PTS sugar transporter subunit IIA [Rhodopseudomonas pseudopalustris]SEP37927.1 PTS IIA-like nitrogen-regulatory protein PtsN [Rhodopseudomonas pseudopalustris]
MKIADFLSPANVLFDLRGSDKSKLLADLSARAAAGVDLAPTQVAPYLIKREELGSTGIGEGVAIPHTRLPDLRRPFGLLAKLRTPVEFDAIDAQAVDIVFVLLLPAVADNAHLGEIALVARTFRSAETRERVRRSKDASQLYAAVSCA